MAVRPQPTYRRPFGWLENVQGWAAGHSYISGSGAGPLSKLLLGRHNMQSYTGIGGAGSNAGQMASQLKPYLGAGTTYSNSLTALVVLCSLINDVNGSFTSATVVEEFRSCFAQLWGYFITYTMGSFVFGSGWSAGVTTTAGSFFDFSWYGDTGYLLVGFTTGAAVNLTITNSGTGGATAQTPNIGGYSNAFPGVIKLGGYGSGRHTVRVTLTSGAGMTVYGGLMANPYPPQVLWAQEGPIVSFSGTQNTLMATFAAAVAAILPDFPNVTQVAVDANWNNAVMQYGDGTHLNAKGVEYWTDLLEAAAYKLGYVAGLTNMFAYPSANLAITGSLVAASFPTANYNTGTVPATNFTNLTTWVSSANYVYTQSPDPDFGSGAAPSYVGANLVITGGTGWTPGTYVVIANGGAGPGGRTMLEVVPCPPLFLPSGVVTAVPAVANTAGGAGHLSV